MYLMPVDVLLLLQPLPVRPVSLYYLAFNIFSIVQQRIVNKQVASASSAGGTDGPGGDGQAGRPPKSPKGGGPRGRRRPTARRTGGPRSARAASWRRPSPTRRSGRRGKARQLVGPRRAGEPLLCASSARCFPITTRERLESDTERWCPDRDRGLLYSGETPFDPALSHEACRDQPGSPSPGSGEGQREVRGGGPPSVSLLNEEGGRSRDGSSWWW